MLDCAQVLPVWSAALDPHVLRARLVSPADVARPCWFDPAAWRIRHLAGVDLQHLAFTCAGEVARIDLVGDGRFAGPAVLQFDIVADERLACQLAAVRRMFGMAAVSSEPRRLQRQHLSLLAHDVHAGGASLRETAGLILGEGEWPGDGEHRKSLMRRLIDAGDRLLAAGAGAVLR
ncbi:hypothetical protein [Novosphingobium resinovorum]|uniref:hypothetical protein n=1 Tax=Novosphingobium resinovorum TaxID=158500 RepID=UPI002ED09265|nr:hypothetical protein [Novosphingobium resinovorum]